MATIGDVARRAGVSKVTVSRVLNGASNVNELTRARVEQVMDELQYVPNLAARSLRSRQTQTIALVVPDITNVFWTTVARGVEDTAQRGGYSVFLGNTDENPEKQQSYLTTILKQRVDGVIIAPANREAKRITPLREMNVPTVVIDRKVEGWDVDSVRGDSIGGACSIVEHLISLGHKRIAMLTGPIGASTAEDRVGGYLLALEKNGMSVDQSLIRWGEFRASFGEQATKELLEAGLMPDAIFAANNLIGLGVWECLTQLGSRVPQDVALVFFDEMADAGRTFQFFTVAAQPAYDIGAAAGNQLINRIKRIDTGGVKDLVLPTHLVLRTSCGRSVNNNNLGLPDWAGGMRQPVEVREVPVLSSHEQDIANLMVRKLLG